MERKRFVALMCAAGALFGAFAATTVADQPRTLYDAWVESKPTGNERTLADVWKEAHPGLVSELPPQPEPPKPWPPSNEDRTLSEQFGDAMEEAGDAISNLFRGDYCDCIFSKMPSVKNDIAARAVVAECRKRGSGCESKSGSWFGPSSAADCIKKYGSDTPSEGAALAISRACRAVY